MLPPIAQICSSTISKSSTPENQLSNAIEVIPNHIYFAVLDEDPNKHEGTKRRSKTHSKKSSKSLKDEQKIIFVSVDKELIYWNFFTDFGPLNLGHLYRFCAKFNSLCRDKPDHKLCLFSNKFKPELNVNAICLLGCWLVLYREMTPEEAIRPFVSILSSLPSFRDASASECTYNLTVLDCLRGLAKAKIYNFFDFNKFNLAEYEYFEQVENGDLSWIIQDKIIAFAGPQKEKVYTKDGYYTLTPSDFNPYFKERRVEMVIRLNKAIYDENEFKRAGIKHVDSYYLDGSCPPISQLEEILQEMENCPRHAAMAIHCKAGLGRTGTCIGAYLMKKYKFTAAEAIGWMRICRPGMVIGPQQHFLEEIQQILWSSSTKRSSLQEEISLLNNSTNMEERNELQKARFDDLNKEQIKILERQDEEPTTEFSYTSWLPFESLSLFQRRNDSETQADSLLARRQDHSLKNNCAKMTRY